MLIWLIQCGIFSYDIVKEAAYLCAHGEDTHLAMAGTYVNVQYDAYQKL